MQRPFSKESDSAPCTAASHAALKADPAAWSALAYVGLQVVEPDEEPGATLEVRQCSGCSSTLAIEVVVDTTPDVGDEIDPCLRYGCDEPGEMSSGYCSTACQREERETYGGAA